MAKGEQFIKNTEENTAEKELSSKTEELSSVLDSQESAISINEPEKPKVNKEKIAAGTAGAFILSIIGVFIWYALYAYGFTEVSGLILAFLAINGYKRFGKKLSILGVAISTIISIVMVVVSELFCMVMLAYKTLSDSYGLSFAQSVKTFPKLMANGSVKNTFISDIKSGMALVLLVGAVYLISVSIKRDKSKEK